MNCERCESPLNQFGRCTDETCPFSDHDIGCLRGWAGHPDCPGVDECSECHCDKKAIEFTTPIFSGEDLIDRTPVTISIGQIQMLIDAVVRAVENGDMDTLKNVSSQIDIATSI